MNQSRGAFVGTVRSTNNDVNPLVLTEEHTITTKTHQRHQDTLLEENVKDLTLELDSSRVTAKELTSELDTVRQTVLMMRENMLDKGRCINELVIELDILNKQRVSPALNKDMKQAPLPPREGGPLGSSSPAPRQMHWSMKNEAYGEA